MHHSDILALDAVGQAAALRAGACSPRELVAAAIARIEALNPALNAVIHQRFEQALIEAAQPLEAAPFAGVPFLVKDLMCTTAGDPYHCGSRFLQRLAHRAAADTHLAGRYRAAGLRVLGRTNTPEFGTVTTTEPLAYGPTRNPWDRNRSPGGSSGGSAAAVASGMVAAAHGNDGGGSLRIPAAHCGLVGLKPSRGRISHAPRRGEVWLGTASDHVLTRSVRDSAALLDCTAGHLAGDPYRSAAPLRPYFQDASEDPAPLRIGVMASVPGVAGPLEPAIQAALTHTITRLEQLGHRVRISYPAVLDEPEPERHFMRMIAAWVAHDIDEAVADLGHAPRAGDLEAHTEILYRMGKALTATDYLRAQVYLQARARAIQAWWTQGDDLLMTPTCPAPPLIGAFAATPEDPLRPLRGTAPYMAWTAPFNITGQPAISLPLARTTQGLPLGVQFIAALGREDQLFALAGQLERAAPWATAPAMG